MQERRPAGDFRRLRPPHFRLCGACGQGWRPSDGRAHRRRLKGPDHRVPCGGSRCGRPRRHYLRRSRALLRLGPCPFLLLCHLAGQECGHPHPGKRYRGRSVQRHRHFHGLCAQNRCSGRPEPGSYHGVRYGPAGPRRYVRRHFLLPGSGGHQRAFHRPDLFRIFHQLCRSLPGAGTGPGGHPRWTTSWS